MKTLEEKAKEKAEELFETFSDNYTFNGERNAIDCANNCVDEILKAIESHGSHSQKLFWKNVKREISNL